AAIAAAAADGLGHQGRRAIPSRPDGPFDVGQDLPTVAAAAAAAPKAQGDGAAARTRNTEGGGNREAAVAAAAAHGLGKETGGLLSMGADETLVAGLDEGAVAPAGAIAAEPDRDGPAAGSAARAAHTHVVSPIAAAAADGTGKQDRAVL